jgi:hypothetical protein
MGGQVPFASIYIGGKDVSYGKDSKTLIDFTYTRRANGKNEMQANLTAPAGGQIEKDLASTGALSFRFGYDDAEKSPLFHMESSLYSAKVGRFMHLLIHGKTNTLVNSGKPDPTKCVEHSNYALDPDIHSKPSNVVETRFDDVGIDTEWVLPTADFVKRHVSRETSLATIPASLVNGYSPLQQTFRDLRFDSIDSGEEKLGQERNGEISSLGQKAGYTFAFFDEYDPPKIIYIPYYVTAGSSGSISTDSWNPLVISFFPEVNIRLMRDGAGQATQRMIAFDAYSGDQVSLRTQHNVTVEAASGAARYKAKLQTGINSGSKRFFESFDNINWSIRRLRTYSDEMWYLVNRAKLVLSGTPTYSLFSSLQIQVAGTEGKHHEGKFKIVEIIDTINNANYVTVLELQRIFDDDEVQLGGHIPTWQLENGDPGKTTDYD